MITRGETGWRMVACALIFTLIISCTRSVDGDIKCEETCEDGATVMVIDSAQVIRVATIESAFSYYSESDGEEGGYDYDLARAFADYMNLEFQLVVAHDAGHMMEMLGKNEVDLVAYRVAHNRYNERYGIFASNNSFTPMVLVQRRSGKQATNVTQLVGDTVYVRSGCKYELRMHNLNKELGGGITIATMGDSVRSVDLVLAVSRGDIKYCVVDEDMARLYGMKLRNITYALKVGHNSAKSWAFNKNDSTLLVAFDDWYASLQGGRLLRTLDDRYLRRNTYLAQLLPGSNVRKGEVSPYDSTFKKEAKMLGWDWRMLAAVAWNESHFNATAMSSQGAAGVMQMMPRTAAKFGLNDNDIYDPHLNIAAGARYIKRLDAIFKKEVSDSEERIKFILAGYNAGPGHVFDAMALAEKYGYNPHVWYDNVDQFILKLNDGQYYRDSVCKHGFFRGKHTVRYVDDVYDTYTRFVEKTH